VKRNPIPEITLEKLETWPTKRLLGRLNALRKFEESLEASDMTLNEHQPKLGILFKSDSRWSNAYKDLKSILDNREHLERGKAARKAQAKTKR